ncbi:unnamed protein product [Leptosia nina]|uniref:Uncharacterized protein n=1 Tax=Leptosia nina TaxID=320188 RepID=A0AAV1JLB0_9NEOP
MVRNSKVCDEGNFLESRSVLAASNKEQCEEASGCRIWGRYCGLSRIYENKPETTQWRDLIVLEGIRDRATFQLEDFCKLKISRMESWLGDVKRVKIPRPKFASKYPAEPPKDYLDERSDLSGKGRHHVNKDIAKATEELRRSLQEKL